MYLVLNTRGAGNILETGRHAFVHIFIWLQEKLNPFISNMVYAI